MDESSINPYQSPLADQPGEVNLDIQPSCPAYTLYSVGSVTLSAVLGSLLAGGIVMAINYTRLGQGVEAIHAVGWSAVATVVVITAGAIAR